jgi:hypothetical protein
MTSVIAAQKLRADVAPKGLVKPADGDHPRTLGRKD